jgi:hypothetical protein
MVKWNSQVLGWPTALAIVAALLATELAPVVFGTGENATVDWGFMYVTMRFMLVPAACIIHVAISIIRAFLHRGSPLKANIRLLSSTALTASLLYYLFAHPMPMFV